MKCYCRSARPNSPQCPPITTPLLTSNVPKLVKSPSLCFLLPAMILQSWKMGTTIQSVLFCTTRQVKIFTVVSICKLFWLSRKRDIFRLFWSFYHSISLYDMQTNLVKISCICSYLCLSLYLHFNFSALRVVSVTGMGAKSAEIHIFGPNLLLTTSGKPTPL